MVLRTPQNFGSEAEKFVIAHKTSDNNDNAALPLSRVQNTALKGACNFYYFLNFFRYTEEMK